ncbi:MAG: phenylalanine--tRNA ligase subunit beta [Elusimicrobiota bacterium]|jgi:phenylalanyl-tRNA synthetase beta chain|nr:phenylalanine--tRNA ligase subunit beta [Elusimicrobiota bacterium]
MKISYNWLKKFVDFKLSPREIADILTFIGIETNIISSGYNWTKVITAKVLSVKKHPNADKLSVCLLNDGVNDYHIVCGAQNVAAGQIVPLSLIGAVLPGEFEIKKSKIRGIDSEGMICSKSELGLAQKSDGIMVLPDNTKIGVPLESVLESDAIFEVEITSNRGDCLSHLGIAREIAAKLKSTINMPMIKQAYRVSVINDIKIESKLCSRYIGTILTGVKVAPSPKWIVDSLEKCGIRPINNIVDITNFVMLELGQPLHAFDISKLVSNKIIVRNAKEEETITALDSKTYALDPQMLVIADEKKPIAIAGVMGGEYSGIDENTTAVFLESAIFDSSSIRKTSKKLKLSSDSSYRYERGVSWDICELASWRAENLIAQISGGHLEKREDVKNIDYKRPEVLLRLEKIERVLGYSIDEERVAQILRFLGIDLQPRLRVILCSIPSWRNDIKGEIDLIEEIVRINGYDKIPRADYDNTNQLTADVSFFPKIVQLFRHRLYGLGFCEAMNYSFSEIKELELFGLKHSYKIANPVSKENEVLRPSLFCALYKNLINNLGQGASCVSLFEYGKIYTDNGERKTFGAIAYGSVWHEWWGWQNNDFNTQYNFYFLGGLIKNILPDKQFSVAQNLNPHPYFHTGKTASIVYRGKSVGQFGIIKPSIARDLKNEIAYLEIDIEQLQDYYEENALVFKPFSRLPHLKRDISIIAPADIAFAKIESVIKNVMKSSNLLKDYSLFSVYKDDKKVGKDKISYSLRLFYKSEEKTLTDEEANKDMNLLLEKLDKELNINLRDYSINFNKKHFLCDKQFKYN